MTLEQAIIIVRSLERNNTGGKNLFVNVAIAKVIEAAQLAKIQRAV